MAEAHEKDGQEIEDEEEEEYVLLELDDCLYSDIPAGAAYVLSGLDTLTPTLLIGDGLKMTGEYEETVGTCFLFSERDAPQKTSSDEMPLYGKCEDKQAKNRKEEPSKEVKHLASVHKILRFRSTDVDQQQHRAFQHNDREI